MNKDYFSSHSKIYATFRPVYPAELYDFILSHVKQKQNAWDCGTGNGQVAQVLANHFDHVIATDISQPQLEQAVKAKNIEYTITPAESTPFKAQQFDLITVAQALHWFKVDNFYNEVRRTSRRDGVIAVWGYGMLNVAPEIDKLFNKFYYEVVGSYWDEARKHVENGYETIPFPFEQIPPKRQFVITAHWTPTHFAGYLTSWSATQKFIRGKSFDPVPEFMREILPLWNIDEVKTVTFPIFLKAGRVHS
jgi:ubiquinone/menaquinone biosynthesis C-methylase UbiE